MKIFTNIENEKFIEVKTKLGVLYKSLKTSYYYEHKNDKMVVVNNSLNQGKFNNEARANGFNTLNGYGVE